MKEKLQLMPQKHYHKRLLQNNYAAIKWRTWKKWTNS